MNALALARTPEASGTNSSSRVDWSSECRRPESPSLRASAAATTNSGAKAAQARSPTVPRPSVTGRALSAAPTPAERWIRAVNRTWNRNAAMPAMLKKFPNHAARCPSPLVACSTAQLNCRSMTCPTATPSRSASAVARTWSEPSRSANPPRPDAACRSGVFSVPAPEWRRCNTPTSAAASTRSAAASRRAVRGLPIAAAARAACPPAIPPSSPPAPTKPNRRRACRASRR